MLNHKFTTSWISCVFFVFPLIFLVICLLMLGDLAKVISIWGSHIVAKMPLYLQITKCLKSSLTLFGHLILGHRFEPRSLEISDSTLQIWMQIEKYIIVKVIVLEAELVVKFDINTEEKERNHQHCLRIWLLFAFNFPSWKTFTFAWFGKHDLQKSFHTSKCYYTIIE